MITFILIVALLAIISLFAGIITYQKDFKYYKPIYKTLPNRQFVRNYEQVYSHDGFVWFTDNNDFCLYSNNNIWSYVSLFGGFITFTSPYSYYWLRKYRKWFKENVDFNALEEYDVTKHKFVNY